MNFFQKCKTKKLGMIYTILGSFCLFLNWERAEIRPEIRSTKMSVLTEFKVFLWGSILSDIL